MTFKKRLQSEADIVIAGGDPEALFPIDFKYVVGDVVYTVKQRFYADNTEFRRLVTEDGSVEDVTIETIIKDLKSPNSHVVEDPRENKKE